ncbi:MAG: hypothetical protein U1E76_06365 [Planctomycetota bacterium]
MSGQAIGVWKSEYDEMGNRTLLQDATPGGPALRSEYTYDARHRLVETQRFNAAGALVTESGYELDGCGQPHARHRQHRSREVHAGRRRPRIEPVHQDAVRCEIVRRERQSHRVGHQDRGL